MPARPTTTRSGAAASTSAVTGVALRTMLQFPAAYVGRQPEVEDADGREQGHGGRDGDDDVALKGSKGIGLAAQQEGDFNIPAGPEPNAAWPGAARPPSKVRPRGLAALLPRRYPGRIAGRAIGRSLPAGVTHASYCARHS